MKHNSIIIGAGVAGMTLAIYLKRAGVDFALIEGSKPGGQINFAPSVENFPSYEKVRGFELAKKIFEQVKSLDINYINSEVILVDNQDGEYKLKLKDGSFITTSTIFIATGKKIKKLDIPNVNEFLGSGLSYCATCDGSFFEGKDVIVVGDTNKALEEAMYLSGICKKVIVLSESGEMTANNFYREKVSSANNIEVIHNATLKELIKENNMLTKALIEVFGEEKILNISGCFAYVGYIPNSELFNKLVELDGDNYIVVDSNMKTSAENIYAIGDVNDRKFFQLLSAMNDAVVASFDYLKKV